MATIARVTFYVDDDTGPSCGGSSIYLPNGRAVMDNGPPSSSARCDDTMLHEYGHAVQYGVYGGWGRPSECNCSNHGGTANDCSHDAFIEGWAEYFPAMVYHHINSNDTHYDWSNSSSSHNLETNSTGDTEERDEWTFAGALWDIYDTPADTGDTLALGDDEIWTVMRNDKPKTVEEFFQKFITRYPQHAAGLEQIYIAHNMHPNWLTLNTTQLSFGLTQTQLSFTIQRLNWYGAGDVVDPTWAVTDDATWITSISPASGDTTTETDTVTVTIDRSGLAAGLHTATITVAPQYYGRPQQITVTCQAGIPPDTPSPIAPANGALTVSLTPVLQASAFSSSTPGDTHAAAQWQVDDNSDFSSPEYDSHGTSADKTQVTVPAGVLAYRGVYYWCVRYQSDNGMWSDWSAPVWSFRCTCNGVRADVDGDCDVDTADLAVFQSCLSGQGKPYPTPACANLDADADGDIDQSDFGVFQRCLSGPFVQARSRLRAVTVAGQSTNHASALRELLRPHRSMRRVCVQSKKRLDFKASFP